MKIRGFTLLELLVTIALAAILLAVAAPSFTNIIRNNALGSARDSLYSALQFARTEAVSRNTAVGLCPSASAALNSCGDNDGDWAEFGWIVFVDDGADEGTGTVNANTILRVHEGFENIEIEYSVDEHIRYISSGLLDAGFSGGTISVCDPDNNATNRSVLVAPSTGQVRTGGEADAGC